MSAGALGAEEFKASIDHLGLIMTKLVQPTNPQMMTIGSTIPPSFAVHDLLE